MADLGNDDDQLNNHKQLTNLKKEVAILDQDIYASESLKQRSDENNQYE